MRLCYWAISPLLILSSSAVWAQATENAVTEAGDAFGFVNGDESVGIYDTASVRGFNLEASGNYRVNGYYFVKSSGTSSFFLDTTTVRIGLNTLGLDLPGPSGVVDFRLRNPERDEPSLVTAGLHEQGSPYLDFQFKHRSSDGKWSTSVGLGLEADGQNHQGDKYAAWLLAGTVRYQPTDASFVQIYAGEYDYERDAKFKLRTDGTFLPAAIRRNNRLVEDWAEEHGQRRIVGGLYEHDLADGWKFGFHAAFSEDDPTSAFQQIFTQSEPGDTATGIVVAAPHQRFTAWSGEAKLRRTFETGDWSHDLAAMVRGRMTRNKIGGEEVISLGTRSLEERGAPVAAPLLQNTADNRNEVDQWGVGLSYQLTWRDRLRLSAGLLRSDYEKTFRTPIEASVNGAKPWLYNVGAALRLVDGVDLYGSYSRGLEEAGIAPPNAANRNAVLDAIIVTQRELGFKVNVTPGLMAVIAGFDTRKPYAGLDADTNVYDLFGTVRHRGIEASLSGQVTPDITLVLGGVLIDAKISDSDAQAGLRGDKPVGVPETRLIANVDWRVPSVEGLSLDAGLAYEGKRAASTRLIDGAQLMLGGDITVDLGARYRFGIGKLPVTLRAQLLNVFNDYSWTVSSAETFDYKPARTFRVALTGEF